MEPASEEPHGQAVERHGASRSRRKGQPAPTTRVTDADRQKVVEQLRLNASAGSLDMEEFAERTELALGARTFGDLEPLTEDLPTILSPAERARKLKRKRQEALGPYLMVMTLLVGIWLATTIAAGRLTFFWPIFPMLGWGIPLLFGLRDLRPGSGDD